MDVPNDRLNGDYYFVGPQKDDLVNGYACTECDWHWGWAMGDRVAMVKQHQLAHLIAAKLLARRAEIFSIDSEDYSRFALEAGEQSALTSAWLNDEARQAPMQRRCD